jgi:cell volume regulation protein A
MAVSAFLIFVARPLSVFISLSFFKMRIQSRWFISWVGLRGAVPIVLATYPLIAGVNKAGMIFNVVFFISLTSVMIQGTSLSSVAKWLKVSLPVRRNKVRAGLDLAESGKSRLVQILIPEDSAIPGKRILQLGLPEKLVIALILRDGSYFTPTGSTKLKINDKLYILGESEESLNKTLIALGLSGKEETFDEGEVNEADV